MNALTFKFVLAFGLALGLGTAPTAWAVPGQVPNPNQGNPALSNAARAQSNAAIAQQQAANLESANEIRKMRELARTKQLEAEERRKAAQAKRNEIKKLSERYKADIKKAAENLRIRVNNLAQTPEDASKEAKQLARSNRDLAGSAILLKASDTANFFADPRQAKKNALEISELVELAIKDSAKIPPAAAAAAANSKPPETAVQEIREVLKKKIESKLPEALANQDSENRTRSAAETFTNVDAFKKGAPPANPPPNQLTIDDAGHQTIERMMNSEQNS